MDITDFHRMLAVDIYDAVLTKKKIIRKVQKCECNKICQNSKCEAKPSIPSSMREGVSVFFIIISVENICKNQLFLDCIYSASPN